jgi:(1->4)-alpha-D-glucan 1-alpha-D-glucosylmutase
VRADTDTLTPRISELARCFEKLIREAPARRPRSTYRIQFHHAFRFEDAIPLIPHLHDLGISHLYASPILKARAGSTHGYDITDHNCLNPEIGTETDLRRLVAELKRHGMALMIDLVPNHMGVGEGDNPWWQDVLMNGRAAEHADYFDIDWLPLKSELRDKVLLPVLGDQYGVELENARLKLRFDGRFAIVYYDKIFPIDPQTIPLIFKDSPDLPSDFSDLLRRLDAVPRHWESEPARVASRRELVPKLLSELRDIAERDSALRASIDALVKKINGRADQPKSFDSLHELLEAQPYRLALWRVSAEEINYRRFFDVNDLVGLRMENPAVFASTHSLIRRLFGEGLVEAARIDHPDGLLNPRQYFTRLQMLFTASRCCGPEPIPPLAENGIEEEVQTAFGTSDALQATKPLYVVVEKILESGETLPKEWLVDGTSGYEFGNLVNELFIVQQNEEAFTKIYQRFTGSVADPHEQLYLAKKNILDTALSGELNVLAHLLDELSSTDRRARDFTRKALRDALREAIACFPIYRAYIDERGEIIPRDRGYIDQAIRRAKRRNPSTAAQLYDFLRSNLLLEGGPEIRARQLHFTLKFQQLTGPVMAKGLEDTVCYTFNRFISVNEVGGAPDHFGISQDDFHHANAERSRVWPHSMLSTSTHDTKRSEDVRARLNVLSEMPRQWSQSVLRWHRSNIRFKVRLADGRIAPDNNEEYFLYQTLIGSWPFALDAADSEVRGRYIGRIEQYMDKALHEAKVNLSWINPDPEYSDAVKQFIHAILTPSPRGRLSFFLRDLQEFVRSIQFFGALNSLAQTLLKLTAPGVPDIYQGNEFFDFSLVDPDNRRPVDFDGHRRLLAGLQAQSPADFVPFCHDLLANYQDGRVKAWVTMRALAFRRENPELFSKGDYTALHAAGDRRPHVVSFARGHAGKMAISAVSRFSHSLLKGRVALPVGENWGTTELLLPADAPEFYENVLTGELLRSTPQRTLFARDLFAHFPVALLSAR